MLSRKDDFIVFKVSVQQAKRNQLSSPVEPELEMKEEQGKYMSRRALKPLLISLKPAGAPT